MITKIILYKQHPGQKTWQLQTPVRLPRKHRKTPDREVEVGEKQRMLCFTHGNFSGICKVESVQLPTTVQTVYNPETLSSFH